jgi:hypothetical protein
MKRVTGRGIDSIEILDASRIEGNHLLFVRNDRTGLTGCQLFINHDVASRSPCRTITTR